MVFSAEDYKDAAMARAATALHLHGQRRYAAAIYFSGVAVECLLRAYLRRKDPVFEPRHDLPDLMASAELTEFVSPQKRQVIVIWLSTVWLRWKNNYRYADDDRLRSEFKKLKHDRGIKGDFMKENSRMVVDAALELITEGERRWTSRKS